MLFHLPLPLPVGEALELAAATGERMVSCSPVVFNDIKYLARSMPADGLEAQDVVPPRCGCWVAHIAIFSSRRSVFGQSTHARARTRSRRTQGRLPRPVPPGVRRRARRCRACCRNSVGAPQLWSVVAQAVVRACLTSIGIVRVLLRRLGLPRALVVAARGQERAPPTRKDRARNRLHARFVSHRRAFGAAQAPFA